MSNSHIAEIGAKTEELRALVNTAMQSRDVAPSPQLAAPASAQPKDKRMNKDKPELPAYFVAIVALLCIAVLTFNGDKVPEIFSLAVIGALGISGAVTNPGGPKLT